MPFAFISPLFVLDLVDQFLLDKVNIYQKSPLVASSSKMSLRIDFYTCTCKFRATSGQHEHDVRKKNDMKYKDTAVYDIPHYICSTLAYRYLGTMHAWQFATVQMYRYRK